MDPSTVEGHWNKTYSSQPAQETGWYERRPDLSLELIKACNLTPDDPIVDVGVGASTLFIHLLKLGYRNLWGIDISDIALSKLRSGLGAEKASQINLIHGDVTEFRWMDGIGEIALWHDRAMLHFLVDELDRRKYACALRNLVRLGGFVILATFAKGGASKCSGLDVRNYDEGMMLELLGNDFSILRSIPYIYTMPSGDQRLYLYALFTRTQSS